MFSIDTKTWFSLPDSVTLCLTTKREYHAIENEVQTRSRTSGHKLHIYINYIEHICCDLSFDYDSAME